MDGDRVHRARSFSGSANPLHHRRGTIGALDTPPVFTSSPLSSPASSSSGSGSTLASPSAPVSILQQRTATLEALNMSPRFGPTFGAGAARGSPPAASSSVFFPNTTSAAGRAGVARARAKSQSSAGMGDMVTFLSSPF
eukprot:m.64259 g.64259  ORF g.64259 m.64259 type:complete len:139 (+) comp16415_c3_seq1:102-518(+)